MWNFQCLLCMIMRLSMTLHILGCFVSFGYVFFNIYMFHKRLLVKNTKLHNLHELMLRPYSSLICMFHIVTVTYLYVFLAQNICIHWS